MKNPFSLISLIVVFAVLFGFRYTNTTQSSGQRMMFTEWDGLGYYMYLPSAFIYNDFTELKWMDKIDSTYHVTGGALYQSNIHDNGNYVNKYLGGVAILELPFFTIGHIVALNSDYPADGFSPPYQYALAYGALLYTFLALLLLRNILLRYFDDRSVGVSMILLVLASNLIQYTSIDAGMSHVYIFPLYVIILYATLKWHEKPSIRMAALIGLTIGLATISRPTELVMLFIPLLWGTNTKEKSKAKWALVKENKSHLIWVLLFGLIGILPQLIYWKMTSGSFVYNVGSSWRFLTPYFRSLFGWEIGWFIYTPITIFFIIGMFFIKQFPFKKSVITFCLLNIWIIISWADWKYGATYSSRALSQSYPIFALPFTAFISKVNTTKWKYVFYAIGTYLVFVNMFQINQYGKTILHYRDMNRQYYGRIYLNSNPSPLDMSLLDNDMVMDASDYSQVNTYLFSDTSGANEYYQVSKKIELNAGNWLRINADVQAEIGFDNSYLGARIIQQKDSLERSIRLFSPISFPQQNNPYEFHLEVPENMNGATELQVFIRSNGSFKGSISNIKVDRFQ